MSAKSKRGVESSRQRYNGFTIVKRINNGGKQATDGKSDIDRSFHSNSIPIFAKLSMENRFGTKIETEPSITNK